MKVSVIIPTYRPQSYLWECLGSLCNQTMKHDEYEVVVVLNGEREPYEQDVRDFFRAHCGVAWKYAYSQEAGVSNARNVGLDMASGKYITFIDDDDYVSPTYLEGLYNASGQECIGVSHPVAFLDATGERVKYRLEDTYERAVGSKGMRRLDFQVVRRILQSPCMMMLHRDIIGERRFDRTFRNGEDSLFMFMISDKFSLIECASEDVIYFRRIRMGSANFSTTFSYRLRNSLKMILRYTEMYVHDIRSYRFSFYLTRVLGAIKTILIA